MANLFSQCFNADLVGVPIMNAGLNRCTLLLQSLVTATIILVGMNPAQAQNPADSDDKCTKIY